MDELQDVELINQVGSDIDDKEKPSWKDLVNISKF